MRGKREESGRSIAAEIAAVLRKASAKGIRAEYYGITWHAGCDQTSCHAMDFCFEGEKCLHRRFFGIQVFAKFGQAFVGCEATISREFDCY